MTSIHNSRGIGFTERSVNDPGNVAEGNAIPGSCFAVTGSVEDC